MKFICYSLLLLLLLSCSEYQVSSISKNRALIVENKSFLFIKWGHVYSCKTNDFGEITDCVKNDIKDILAI